LLGRIPAERDDAEAPTRRAGSLQAGTVRVIEHTVVDLRRELLASESGLPCEGRIL